MSYTEFQQYMARYGFVSCPLSELQFNEALAYGATVDQLYGIACDVNAGVAFSLACRANGIGLPSRPGTLIYDFFIGVSRSGKVWVKRYTYVEDPHTRGNGCYSDNPLYEFPIETIGL